MNSSQSNSIAVLRDLRERYPETPFLALGQTVWWDEPMKAVLLRILESAGLGGKMVLGVHDTDYFAKVKVRQAGQSRFELMPHNDGSTKDLWSAAGEISRLFGSETFPTRQDFVRHGVPFDRVASAQGMSRLELLNSVTEAWGWRGLVYTGSRDLIVHSLPLKDMGDSVEEMLRWGFNGTYESIVDGCCRKEARAVGGRLLEWVGAYRSQNPDATLSDLYQHLFPRLVELLLGAPPRNIQVDCTTRLLNFNPETAALPRFQLLDLFLNEETGKLAAEAYNNAVASSEIYTLDRFGLGALPFDVVIPSHGRGTLRVTLRAIHVETRQPIRIPLAEPVTTVGGLARVLTARFGDQVTLVGKAVALISMLAREFIFVFSDEGSPYVKRTRCMNDELRARGIGLPLHPILRLRYATWDALDVGHVTLGLPEHLASSFGQSEIASAEFASGWESVVAEQAKRLAVIKEIRRPRELMEFLAGVTHGDWTHRLEAFDAGKRTLCKIQDRTASLRQNVRVRYEELAEIKSAIRDTELEKSAHFHAITDWTPEEMARRNEYDCVLGELLARRHKVIEEIRSCKARRLKIERGSAAAKARRRIDQVVIQAERARLELVKNAVLTCSGLPHSQHRPSAWWLPMLDPYGHWFNRIVDTAEAYLEPVLTDEG